LYEGSWGSYNVFEHPKVSKPAHFGLEYGMSIVVMSLGGIGKYIFYNKILVPWGGGQLALHPYY
jgi:hypothetical protein